MGAPAPSNQSARKPTRRSTRSAIGGHDRPLDRRGVVRVLVAGVVAAVLATAALVWLGDGAQGEEDPQPVPRARCGPGARPETDIQGRVPRADYTSGRVDLGYRCNTRAVSHVGRTGGFKVHRYTDRRGHTCAFYDNTLVFPGTCSTTRRRASAPPCSPWTTPAGRAGRPP